MGNSGELPGADGPLYFDPTMADSGELPDADATPVLDTDFAYDRIEATFDINPPLSRRHKVIDITARRNHLSPEAILTGGDLWVKFYWSNVNLTIPGEKTLTDPRDPVWSGVTRKWCTAASNASWFIGAFFNPRQTLPENFDPTSTDFQEWLSNWREAGHQLPLGSGETAGNAVPTEAETAAYENQENLQHVNLQYRMYREPAVFVHVEILIMWDFNAAAEPGQVTWPRVSGANLRFCLDVYDTLRGLGHEDRLRCQLMFKDIRNGRYVQTPRSKRYYDNDTILGRQWQAILIQAFDEYDRYLDSSAILGEEAEDTEVAQNKIANAAKRRFRKTWGEGRALNRGQVKFWMCDAFGVSRHLRDEDPEIGAWMRRRAH